LPDVDCRDRVCYDSGMKKEGSKPRSMQREVLREVIFLSNNTAGRIFEISLILCILLSVLIVMLDSVDHYHQAYGRIFYYLEWFFTILFTAEYLLRLYCVHYPLRYALSFFGIVDLLAILPTYFSFFVLGTRYLLAIRILRVLRIFRILKMAQYVEQADLIVEALAASRRKILVFLFAIATLVVIIGALMYLIEGESSGFSSIPTGIYWAVVTLTTVGYGDISPRTPIGQGLAILVMLLGYSIIAVPTGIVTSHIVLRGAWGRRQARCASCGQGEHEPDALFCRKCGQRL